VRRRAEKKVEPVIRLLLSLLGLLTMSRPARRAPAWAEAGDSRRSAHPGVLYADREAPAAAWPEGSMAERPWSHPAGDTAQLEPRGLRGPGPRPRRRRIPLWVKGGAAVVLAGLIFRRAIASVILLALSATLHFLGFNIHLPSIKFAWPWQTITAGTTTNTDLGPWVLQKIEGISKPALGQANFNFLFTHKVSKPMGPLPCWYASTFHAVGRASATVDLNPGPAWWKPAGRHYQLRVLSRPSESTPGRVAVTMVLPPPQLPRSAHDVTIDNIPSAPVATQHSWTYPGLGCGVLLRPQFPDSVLYAQAQQIAFYRSQHDPQITQPLIRTAESQAAHTIRDNFIQPTVNALNYRLDQFTLRWAATQ
jgi:hypothetical protein